MKSAEAMKCVIVLWSIVVLKFLINDSVIKLKDSWYSMTKRCISQ